MRAKTLAAALLLALAAIVVACQGEQEEATPPPTPPLDVEVRQQLEGLSSDALLALTFPGVDLEPLPPAGPLILYLIADEPAWRIQYLDRLLGHLNRRDQPQLAAFLYLDTSPVGDEEPGPRSQLLGLPEGLFMALIELDSQQQPVLAGLTLLDSAAIELVEARAALDENRRPFRQGLDNLAPEGVIEPALAVDADDDGLEEIVLLDAGLSDGIGAAFYLTFRWTGSGLHWQRIAPSPDDASPDLPTQLVLDYLAAVDAATATAEPWQDLQRFLVWEWLADKDAIISDDLLRQLADEDSPAALAAARRKLETVRELFSAAYELQSANWQKLQPWPDFVNGFRNAIGARAEEMLPPSEQDEKTVVEVVVTASSREGPELVQRRFRVTYELVQTEDGWRLDRVAEAREEPLPE